MLNNIILKSAGVPIPRLTADAVILTEDQRMILQSTVRRQTSPQNLVTRCRIILLADERIGVHATMRRLKVGRTTVQNWRKRWLQTSEWGTSLARSRLDLNPPHHNPTNTFWLLRPGEGLCHW